MTDRHEDFCEPVACRKCDGDKLGSYLKKNGKSYCNGSTRKGKK